MASKGPQDKIVYIGQCLNFTDINHVDKNELMMTTYYITLPDKQKIKNTQKTKIRGKLMELLFVWSVSEKDTNTKRTII